MQGFDNLEHKFSPLFASEVLEEGTRIEGYASYFGLADKGGDVVVAGAYAKSLAALAAAEGRVKMLWQHTRPNRLVFGTRCLRMPRAFMSKVDCCATWKKAEKLRPWWPPAASTGFRSVIELCAQPRMIRGSECCRKLSFGKCLW